MKALNTNHLQKKNLMQFKLISKEEASFLPSDNQCDYFRF